MPSKLITATLTTILLNAAILYATVVDVMIIYDTTAKRWVDNVGGINVFSQYAVNKLNQAMQNSNINLTFNLVHASEVSYTHSNYPSIPEGLVNTLYKLQQGVGNLAIVHSWRNQYGADLVSLFVDTGEDYGYVGVGFLLTRSSGDPDYAFNVVNVRSVLAGHTYTHEIGHLFGCHHSKYQAQDPGPNRSLNEYSAGWYFTGTNNVKYHTIMAYNFDGYGNYYTEAPLFSSPLIIHNGAVAGHPTDGDNARTIRETKDVVAAYRQSVQQNYCTLRITLEGTGQGVITSSPTGIHCGSDCSETYPCGTQVTLTQTANSGLFTGWGGACSHAGLNRSCTFTLDSNKDVKAEFNTIKKIITCDLNGDNAKDIIATTNNDGKILYTTNLSSWNRINGFLPTDITCGKINSDNNEDIAGIGHGGSIWYTTNLGNRWTNLPGSLTKIYISDLNGNSVGDIIGINSSKQIWYAPDPIYWSNNNSSWINIPGSLEELTLNDFRPERQGNEIAGINFANSIYYYNFSGWVHIHGHLSNIISGYFNDDNSADLAGINSLGAIYYSTNLSSWNHIPGQLSYITSANLNGDRVSDLIGFNSSYDIWYTTDLRNWRQIPGKAKALVTGDLNRDGRDDIIVIGLDNNLYYTTNLNVWMRL